MDDSDVLKKGNLLMKEDHREKVATCACFSIGRREKVVSRTDADLKLDWAIRVGAPA